MILVAVILLALWTKLNIVSANDKEHVHFKIHVPEIIKHHIHTKTIFIHVHEPKKPPKKNSHLESHYDDWRHYSNYNNAKEYVEGKKDLTTIYDGHQTLRGSHLAHQNRNQGYVASHESFAMPPPPPPLRNDLDYPHYYRENAEPEVPSYPNVQGHYRSSNERDGRPGAAKSVFPNGVVGYSYPPQYDVRENVIENSRENSGEMYRNSHEEGRSRGHLSEIGHLYTNELNNFYDDKQEESSELISIESEEADENRDSNRYRYVDNNYTNRRMTMS